MEDKIEIRKRVSSDMVKERIAWNTFYESMTIPLKDNDVFDYIDVAAVKEINIDPKENKIYIEYEKGCVFLAGNEFFSKHQEAIREYVFNHFNEKMGSVGYKELFAKGNELVIGMRKNLPEGKKYDLNGVLYNNGMYQKYDDSYKQVDVFKFPNGAIYGEIFAVGDSVVSKIAIGDKVLLRSHPERFFFYKGEIYHHINEYDISVIIKKDIDEGNV